MPCRVSSGVHEWINDLPAVPTWGPVNLPLGEKAKDFQRGEKTPWSFTAACCWDMAMIAERRWESPISSPQGFGGDANVTPPLHGCVSYQGVSSGTTAGGQFGWGGTPLKRYQGRPKVSSGGSELRRRGQGQKLASLDPEKRGIQGRKPGLATARAPLSGGRA
jgi:hypothetical protein